MQEDEFPRMGILVKLGKREREGEMVGQWLNSKELARKLGVSDSYGRKLCQRGKVAGARKFGSMWYAPDPSRRIAPPWPWESTDEAASRLSITV